MEYKFDWSDLEVENKYSKFRELFHKVDYKEKKNGQEFEEQHCIESLLVAHPKMTAILGQVWKLRKTLINGPKLYPRIVATELSWDDTQK